MTGTQYDVTTILFSNIAEIFENFSDLTPDDRFKAIDENEGQQNRIKHKKPWYYEMFKMMRPF